MRIINKVTFRCEKGYGNGYEFERKVRERMYNCFLKDILF